MNPFESLCVLVSTHNWCWNIACTTCGARQLRKALREMSDGDIPDSDIPVCCKWDECVLSEDRKEELIRICKDADLHAISQSARFPDWLGCLGLVLHHLSIPSKAIISGVTNPPPGYKSLSDNWSKQLLLMLEQNPSTHDGDAHGFLTELLSDPDSDLQWQDLGRLEMDLGFHGKMGTNSSMADLK